MSPLNDYQEYNLSQEKFDIGFGIFWNDEQSHIYEKQNLNRYIDMQFAQLVMIYDINQDGVKVLKRSLKPINLEQCEIGRFGGLNNSMSLLGMNQLGWYCPQNLDIKLIGQGGSIEKNAIRFQIKQCRNETLINKNYTCVSNEEIFNFTSSITVAIATLKTFFDQDDFQEPLKKDITLDYFGIKVGTAFNQLVSVKRNHLHSKNSLFSSFFKNSQYEFYDVQLDRNYLADIHPNIWEFFNLFVTCSNEEVYIDRARVTIVDIMSIVGGLFVGNGRYQNQWNQEHHQSTQQNKDNVKQVLTFILNKIKNRQRLHINLFGYKLSNLLFCFTKNVHKPIKQQLIENSIKKYQKSFDIIRIQKQLMNLKSIQKLMLKPYQSTLLKFMSPSIVQTDYEKNQKQIKRQKIDVLREVVSKAVNKNNPIDIAILNDIQGEIDIHKRRLTIRQSENEEVLDNYLASGSQKNQEFGLGYASYSLRSINNKNYIDQLALKQIKVDDSVIQPFDNYEMQAIDKISIKKLGKKHDQKIILKKKSMKSPQTKLIKEQSDKTRDSNLDQSTTRKLREEYQSSGRNSSTRRKKTKIPSSFIE
eukprot:403341336